MKFGKVNKSTAVNRFVLLSLHRNITPLAVITRKTNIKLYILKSEGEGGGGGVERAELFAAGKYKNNYHFQKKKKESKSNHEEFFKKSNQLKVQKT